MNTNPYIKLYYKYRWKQMLDTIWLCVIVLLLAIPLLWLFRDINLLFWFVLAAACFLMFVLGCVFVSNDGKTGSPLFYYESVKGEAKQVRERYKNTPEGQLGPPDIKITYNHDFLECQYEKFLFPWRSDVGPYNDAIYADLPDEAKLFIESDLVDYCTWEMTHLKEDEYILVYKEKGLIVLNGKAFSIKDFCRYELSAPVSHSRHVVYDTNTMVDEDARNRRMAAAHMMAGMKGVYMSSLLPDPTVTTTNTRVVESVISDPIISFFIGGNVIITYPYCGYSQSRAVMKGLLEYLDGHKKREMENGYTY